MTLFWHCVFPGDISAKPRRLEIYAYSDCREDNDGFHCVVLWFQDPEYPRPLHVQCVTPPTLTTSPFLGVSLCSAPLSGTKAAWCAEMCQHVSPCTDELYDNKCRISASRCTHTKREVHKGACEWALDDTKTALSCALAGTFFWVNLYMQIYFSSLGWILSLQTREDESFHLLRGDENFISHGAVLSFSHAKQHKFAAPPSVNCQ